jgi:hypothetical protein
MTTVSDIRNRLSADAQFPESEFYSAVFSYGMGVIELLTDGGYAPASTPTSSSRRTWARPRCSPRGRRSAPPSRAP